MCFDWLVTGGILTVNPAHAVRGPKHVRQARQDTRVDDRPGFRIIGSPVSIAFISARFAARRSSQSSCVNDRLKLRENQRFEIAMIV
jgi:hypothetical protein